MLTPENIVVGPTDGVLVDGTLLYTECKITATIQKMSQVQVRNLRQKLQNKTGQKKQSLKIKKALQSKTFLNRSHF